MTISNPDVKHHDAYATFTITNKKKGDQYSDHYKFILVPTNKEIDDKDFYFIEESSDYWDVFGENTKYIADPEECLADNFSFALVYGPDGSMKYKNPEIIQGIIDLMKK